MTPEQRINHYRTYARIYGFMIMEAADDEAFIQDLIEDQSLHPFLKGLRARIEESPVYEGDEDELSK